MTSEIDVVAMKEGVEAALAAHDETRALALLEQLWRLRPGPSNAGYVNTRVAMFESLLPRATARVAIARSYTVEPLVPVLRAAAAVHRVGISVDVGGFGTYTQDILNPASSLYTDDGYDIVILAVQTRDIAPELWDVDGNASTDHSSVRDRVIGEYEAMVTAFRSRSSAHLLIHGLELPAWPTLGLADDRAPLGQSAAVVEINQGLRRLERDHPGVHVLDYDRLIAFRGRQSWHDLGKWHATRMPIRAEYLSDVATEWLRFVFPVIGRTAKVLAVDLDNTLWGGVVGEDGMSGLVLGDRPPGAGYRSLQKAIRALRSRGVVLAVCSKNNPDDAMEVLQSHPAMVLGPDDFAVIRTNWDSKVDNLRSIADELNVGLDSVAFLDDNPVECDLVRHSLPEVTVIELSRIPEEGAHPLIGHPIFERLSLSAEDLNRTEMYAQQRDRRRLEAEAGSLEDYLHSLGTTVRVAEMHTDDVPRVAQLTQKTNQFNLTTRRYSEQEIALAFDDPAVEVFTARAADRFGDHGLIGVVIVHVGQSSWDIDTFLLSCRVIGRGVETAMLSAVVDLAGASGATSVTGTFLPTAKNAPAADFFPAHGFVALDGGERWELQLSARRPSSPEWISREIEVRGSRYGSVGAAQSS